MRILVTGGSGFIGSVLVPYLDNVTVLDSLIYDQYTLGNVANRIQFDRVDVRDFERLKPYLSKADVIIPLAALVGAPLCDLNPVDARLINLEHPLKMLKSLSKDQLVIMPTTESSYGSNDSVCTEETPTNPLSQYAKDKSVVEQALMERENSVSLRLATVFGVSPRMRLDLLVNDFAWRAYKDRSIVLFEAHFKRTVVHVRDVAKAFLHAFSLSSGIYNVGAFSISKMELCKAIEQKTPFKYIEADSGTDPDQRNYVVSSEKLLKTGFQFDWDLSKGLDELLVSFKMLKNTRHGNI